MPRDTLLTEPLDPSLLSRHGLTAEEYARLRERLGRAPTLVELGIVSVMWSEHCSYKSSRVHLKRLPTTGEEVVQGPGENAGAVDIGDGLAAVFKIESHNHPSFIEPYQGAATGVGGILRDVFTMGARPVALLDSLRFGPIDEPRTRYLFERVVAGIAGYGNCVGVPTVGGEVATQDLYRSNPLVNVFCLGLARKDRLFRGQAAGVGNPVMYIGAKTGRDGIHGATMASEAFGDGASEKRPMVQVGDPFMEKLLIEACLELMAGDVIIGIQDMGAAGLTSSSCEMAGRAGTGVDIDVALVPTRETGMTPYEIMLSESQERMLLVAKPGCEAAVRVICEKWGLDVAVIGRVTDTGRLVVRRGDVVAAELPIDLVTDDAPKYERPIAPPPYLDSLQGLSLESLPEPKSYRDALLDVLASPTVASKAWVYRQYDHMVGTNTIVLPGSDAAVLRVKGTDTAVAISVDGNSRYCMLNPYVGGMIAIAEACRNVVCSGARPLGASDCLNFGNPERPEVMWQFALVVDGMADACRAFGVPVVSGNVSFYNETRGIGIYPTPIIGVVGKAPAAQVMTQAFKSSGRVVIVLGETKEELGGTQYLSVVHHREQGLPPELVLDAETALYRCVLELTGDGLVESAHDCSDGGLAVALAECCMSSDTSVGAVITVPNPQGIRRDAMLFGESQSRAVLSAEPHAVERVLAVAARWGVPAAHVGNTGGDRLVIAVADDILVDVELTAVRAAWSDGLSRQLRSSECSSS
ncbi:MAG: phosphoribosylformylglycinamidine synthase subunit PurL [Nitrospirota bacterium]